MNFNQARFSRSAARVSDCPADSDGEAAFAGRSNAGKSSAINTITGRPGLARTSKTPGRTQLLNFFAIAPATYLVDLPGYGFAKVPLEIKKQWQRELERYLRQRQQLRGLILLSDIRHPLKEFDRSMLNWCVECGLPVHVLLTKSDKLKRGQAANVLLTAQREFQDIEGVSFQLFSAVKGTGVNEAQSKLLEWLG